VKSTDSAVLRAVDYTEPGALIARYAELMVAGAAAGERKKTRITKTPHKETIG
jgi:hypothetical protein